MIIIIQIKYYRGFFLHKNMQLTPISCDILHSNLLQNMNIIKTHKYNPFWLTTEFNIIPHAHFVHLTPSDLQKSKWQNFKKIRFVFHTNLLFPSSFFLLFPSVHDQLQYTEDCRVLTKIFFFLFLLLHLMIKKVYQQTITNDLWGCWRWK